MADNYNQYSSETVKLNVEFKNIEQYLVWNDVYPRYFEEPFPPYFDKRYLNEIRLIRKRDKDKSLDPDFDYEAKAKAAGVTNNVNTLLAIIHYIMIVYDGYRYKNIDYSDEGDSIILNDSAEGANIYQYYDNDHGFIQEALGFYQTLIDLFTLKEELEEYIEKLESSADVDKQYTNITYVKLPKSKKIPLAMSARDELAIVSLALERQIDFYADEFHYLNPFISPRNFNLTRADKAYFQQQHDELNRGYSDALQNIAKAAKMKKGKGREEIDYIVESICRSLYKFISANTTIKVGKRGRENKICLLIFHLLACVGLTRTIDKVSILDEAKVKYVEYLLGNKENLIVTPKVTPY